MRRFMLASATLGALSLGASPSQAQAPLEDVIVAVPNFTFNLTATLIADALGLWERNGLRFKMVQISGVGATNAVIADRRPPDHCSG